MEIDNDTLFYDAHFGEGALTFDYMTLSTAETWRVDLVWDWFEDHRAIFPW